ncbi:MAG TPA: amidase family protein, partial [Candidatus Krumholzibacterium sp.]|nr:amidase family protein [Candidatus Krumholzibacterium sp.]
KTNLDEFAMGSSTENSAFFPTRNPWNEDCTPGGSSGGSAAAVAAGMVPVALGSDTGGSIRQPAAFCGVTGLKGTYGRVSRYGLIAFASSLDQIGPITGCTRDAAIVMEVLAGRDPRDSTSMPGDCRGLAGELNKGIEGIRFAIPEETGRWRMDGEVRDIFGMAAGMAGSAGASIMETGLPDMEASIACYHVLANAEASSNLARFDGVRYGFRAGSASMDGMYRETRGEGFGDEVKRRILLGTYVLSSGYYDDYYLKARKIRRYMTERFDEIFRDHDVVLMPATPEPPFELGERTDDPVAMYLSDIFTTPASIAGLPAVTIPAALTSEGLPVAVQLVAGRGGEGILMRAATSLESMLRFSDLVPGGRARPDGKGR